MDISRISENLSVAPQIQPNELAAAATQGFRGIIINRPDGEGGPEQPSSAEITEEAGRHGMQVRYVPVVPGEIGEDDVASFAAALRELPGPVLAYCRTGTRSATLWALSQRGSLSPEEILERTGEAGYDLSELRGKL